MVYLSKSKYCNIWRCPKMQWLMDHKPEEAIQDPESKERMEMGNYIGDLAMDLFGKFVEVTAKKDGKIDKAEMLKRTQEEIDKDTPIICEASFAYNGLFCSVDILRKEDDGYSIYEVKSSTKAKPIYYADLAYQKYVLEHCGLNIRNVYIVHINNKYCLNGKLDIHQLFTINNRSINKKVLKEQNQVEKIIQDAEPILLSTTEPESIFSSRCTSPYSCDFKQYCLRYIPSPSVFDVYDLEMQVKAEYYQKGIVSFEDLSKNDSELTDIQKRQIDYTLHDKGTYINKAGICDFLKTLTYPLYFLDFETFEPALPIYDNTHAYQQIPFLYSLHYIESEGGELKHTDCLAEPGTDPRRLIAEQLVRDIPMDVCVTAYNMKFEKMVIRDLAIAYPDLATHLNNIHDNIKDLMDPFSNGYYYKREMTNSFSIKSVLPAMYPDDQNLDYHSLDDVHNGAEAMNIFPKLTEKTPEEQERIKNSLREYCKLDTLAMVKVWEELVRVSK